MQPLGKRGFESAINVTPLVDVVLVLLIIFMVVAPQLQAGPQLDLPSTDRPADEPEEDRLQVAVARDGTVWIDREQLAPVELDRGLAEAAAGGTDRQVVVRADAALTFGEVRRVLAAADDAGFGRVALLAERKND